MGGLWQSGDIININIGLNFTVPANIVVGRFYVKSNLLEFVRPMKQIYSCNELKAENGIIIRFICTRDESVFDGDAIGDFVFEEVIQNLLEKVEATEVNQGFRPANEPEEGKKNEKPMEKYSKGISSYLKRKSSGEREQMYLYSKMAKKLVI